MIRTYLALLALVTGCADYDPYYVEGDAGADDQIGQAHQAIIYKGAPARQWGVHMNSPGARGNHCHPTMADQTCYYLRSANPFAIPNPVFRIYVNNSFTTAERTLMLNTVNSVGAEIAASFSSHPNGWVIQATTSFTACPNLDTACTNATLRKVDKTMPASGQPGYSHISSYGGLEEMQQCVAVQKSNGMYGNFQACQQAVAGIDLGNIYARGANSTEDTQLLRHAVGNIIMQVIGFGYNSDSSGTPSSLGHTLITPFSGRVPNSVGEVCRGNGFYADQPSSNSISVYTNKCTKN